MKPYEIALLGQWTALPLVIPYLFGVTTGSAPGLRVNLRQGIVLARVFSAFKPIW